jgi:acyl-CoA thioesterase
LPGAPKFRQVFGGQFIGQALLNHPLLLSVILI